MKLNEFWNDNGSKTMTLEDYKKSLYTYFHKGTSVDDLKIFSSGIIFETNRDIQRYVDSGFIINELIKIIDGKSILCRYINAHPLFKNRLVVFPDVEM